MRDHDRPLVSCIMPTRNRRRFARQAIWYFLRQTWEPRELIVVDDGADAIADLIPRDERVRYIRLEQPVSRGAKRNLACEAARGELIAHWDDDDWMSPDRLQLQVEALLAADAAVCGATDLLHYAVEGGQAWSYQPAVNGRPHLAGPTLLYRRAAWMEQLFPEREFGEDQSFIDALPPDALRGMPDPSFYVALMHGGNTVPRNLADPAWVRRPIEEVVGRIGVDADFYVTIRHGDRVRVVAPATSRSSVTLHAPFLLYDGYGSLSEYLLKGMQESGATVHAVPTRFDPTGYDDELLKILEHSQPDPHAPVLCFSWIFEDLARFGPVRDVFIYSMWESSRLPAASLANLARARAVIVPSQFAARAFRESGVSVPLEVVPHGIDPARYHYEERLERAAPTTLMVGTFVPRKNFEEGIAAWKRVFADVSDARLIIKTRFGLRQYVPDDPRISVIDTEEATRGIAHWYRQADILMALGNEGFGLPLLEGMATGLPVIALNSEGQSDICAEAGPAGCLLTVDPVRWQPVDEAPFGPCGVRGVPAVEDVADKLQWVASHRDDARVMGRAASDWAIQHRNVWKMGPAILDIMEQHVESRRPLRRARVVWAPSWQSECGVSEYTAYLAANLPGVHVTPHPPDLPNARLLHVQHEYSLFNESLLVSQVQAARRHRVPVVITEHTVTDHPSDWEAGADALVSLTARGADILRARWPGKLVEHISHGCPTWFPPRKTTRGKVIGAFGFLAPYKGFWRLLDVLRDVPDTELLVFSYARNAAAEAAWSDAARGLPVRRVREFLPLDQVAQRLAAEADILVFWYDDITHASASGAIHLGLATGVPVLTSPTSWFRELRDVTFQPVDLVEGVCRLLDDPTLRNSLTLAARDYCHDHSWERIAERHRSLWEMVERA